MLVLILEKWQLMVLKQSFSFLHRNRTWIAWATSLVAQMVKNLPPMQETWVQSLGREDPLEKGMATHVSLLAWIIPRTEGPCRLQYSLHFPSSKR